MAYAVGMCRSLNIWDVAKNATSDRFPTVAFFATVRLGWVLVNGNAVFGVRFIFLNAVLAVEGIRPSASNTIAPFALFAPVVNLLFILAISLVFYLIRVTTGLPTSGSIVFSNRTNTSKCFEEWRRKVQKWIKSQSEKIGN